MCVQTCLLSGVALMAALLAGGCGNSPYVSVQGKVTCDGKPLEQGSIHFSPLDIQAGRPATGILGPDGQFTASSLAPGDGMLPGEYEVSIVAFSGPPGDPRPGQAKQARKTPLIPANYTDPKRSGLRVTVKPSPSSQTIDVTLNSK